MENNSYIRVAPYLWNSIAGGHDFLVHLCKMIISPGYFFIFDIFILGLLGGEGGGEGKKLKIGQDDKIILSVELHISGTIHHIRGAYDLD